MYALPPGLVPAIVRIVELDFDVLVVGGGIAGCAAALAAAAAGRRVGLVRAAPGATALVAGGWAGPLPEPLGAALARAGMPFEPAPSPLPHPTGRLDGYALAAPAQRAATPLGGALVCGISGLAGFPASALARAWGARSAVMAGAVVLDAGPIPRGGWSPASLAARLEREPGPLAESLAGAVRRVGAARVVFPAVLGVERVDAVRAILEDAAGVPVGEALGTPPSLPGWRLDRALARALGEAGVAVVAGRVVDRVTEGPRLKQVLVRSAHGTAPRGMPDGTEPIDADRDGSTYAIGSGGASHGETGTVVNPGNPGDTVRITARSFVLATGKYLAGGIRAEDRFLEPALGCPVWVEYLGSTFGAPDPLALTHPDREADQPLLRAGVRTDDAGRPVDRRGDVVYENVRVAGTVRSGIDAAAPGLGHAAADGWRAGELAAEDV